MPIVKNGRIAGSSILCLNKVRKKNKRDKEQKMHYFIRDFYRVNVN